MGKNKLERFAELGTFNNVIQPETGIFGKSHPIKGGWKKDVFKNKNPIVLELGCGKGEYTVGLSSIYPENNFIGVDIKGARIWCGAKKSHDNRHPNVAFLRTRIEFINSFFLKMKSRRYGSRSLTLILERIIQTKGLPAPGS